MPPPPTKKINIYIYIHTRPHAPAISTCNRNLSVNAKRVLNSLNVKKIVGIYSWETWQSDEYQIIGSIKLFKRYAEALLLVVIILFKDRQPLASGLFILLQC